VRIVRVAPGRAIGVTEYIHTRKLLSTRPENNWPEIFIQISATEKTARAYVEAWPRTAESVVLSAATEKLDMNSGTASFVSVQATCRLLSSCVVGVVGVSTEHRRRYHIYALETLNVETRCGDTVVLASTG
jgi:hypothetical protein